MNAQSEVRCLRGYYKQWSIGGRKGRKGKGREGGREGGRERGKEEGMDGWK